MVVHLSFFDKYKHVDYARTGDIAVETVNLFEGPLEQFPHNIEPYLRQLGMPTSLQKGIVTLMKDFEVCTKGKPLTSEQARILVKIRIEISSSILIFDLIVLLEIAPASNG